MRRWLLAVVGWGALVEGAHAQFFSPAPGQPQVAPAPAVGAPFGAAPGIGGAPAPKSPLPAEMIIIAQGGVEVRGGPTMQYHPTSKLRFGDKVIVLRESDKQRDWYEIRPPAGSFSWINAKYVKVIDPRTGVVEVEGGAAPVLPGSSVVNKEPNHESVRIAHGSLVALLDRPMESGGQKWFPIAPPPTEVRCIPKDAVMPPQTASVSPQGNWARTPDSFAQPAGSQPAGPSNWGTPGQLTGGNAGGPTSTPASYNQANPWQPHNGVAPQPAQWSSWGKLRRTSFDKDGQPMYVLEDKSGRPLLYVVSQPGTSLKNYQDQTVCLYGVIQYRSDGYQRTHYMVASHVATP